jgi:hypothetical protein
VKTPALAMQQVYTQTKAMYFGALDAQAAADSLGALRAQAAKLRADAQGAVADALAAFEKKAAALEGERIAPGGGGRGGGPATVPTAPDTLRGAAASLAGLMNVMQAADVAPTTNVTTAVAAALGGAKRVMSRWTALERVDLPALNGQLKAAGLAPLMEPGH